MLVLAKRIISAIQRSQEIVAREHTRRELLSRGDRFLEDHGFSRPLLEAGVDAWPWRENTEWDRALLTREERRRMRRAIRELHSYSDRELADLDIARGDISEVVMDGRPGIERLARSA